MTAPPRVSANAKANVDLPLAVGPAMTRTRGELSLLAPRRLAARKVSGVGRRLMRMVLTLIAGLHGRSSLPRLAAAIVEALKIGREPIWLAADEACDLVLDATCPVRVEKTARTLIKGAGIDVLG